jgi:hypothetical protein
MQIVNEKLLIQNGTFGRSIEFTQILAEIRKGIELVDWPDGTGRFAIYPCKPDNRNGVVPIKKNFINHLKSLGWVHEHSFKLMDTDNTGPIDLIKRTPLGVFAVEWETGNVSSSHRALNKIAVGIIQGNIVGGILVLPTKALAKYLTDRIGNYEELMPYFVLYNNLNVANGIIGVVSVEYDFISTEVERIPIGRDGNSKSNRKNNPSTTKPGESF